MIVQIVDILDEHLIEAEVCKNRFIAEWDGDKPKKNEIYHVELDIDDELTWKTNICFTKEKDFVIIQEECDVKIVAKLDYNFENDLAAIRLYDSVILVDVEKIDHDILNEWVVINCHSVKLSNINL